MPKAVKKARRTAAERADDIEAQVRVERGKLELERTKLRIKVAQTRRQMLSTYSGAARNRTTEDWRAKTLSADAAIIGDSAVLNARARQLLRDSWIARSGATGYRRNIVGIGITPRSTARHPETGDDLLDFNRRVDRLWKRWADDPELCDVERRKTMLEIQSLAIMEYVTVGEAIIVEVYRESPDNVGLVLQMFEPEQLNMLLSLNPDTGRNIRGGVEIDEFGGAVTYHFTGVKEPVSASRVRHFYRQERVRQTRGVSLCAPVMLKTRHLEMYDEYQIIAARLEACIGGAIEQAAGESGDFDPFLAPLSGDTGLDANNNTEYVFEPGMMPKLPPGTHINWNTPQKPGGQYEPFTKHQIGQIAAGMGLDYASVARDFTGGSFSSQRQGMIVTEQETDPLQLLMVNLVLRPIRKSFKTLAIVENRVNAPHYLESADWAAAYMSDEWQGPPKQWIDPANQAAAAKIKLDYRLATRAKLLNELGENVSDVFHQIADEKNLANELGFNLPDDAAPGAKPLVAPNEPRPAKAVPTEPPMPDISRRWGVLWDALEWGVHSGAIKPEPAKRFARELLVAELKE